MGNCEGRIFTGHNDWRLPNVRELKSIVNHSAGKPVIFPDFTCEVAIPGNGDTYKFWTSTPDVSGEARAWNVSFCAGSAGRQAFEVPFTMLPNRLYVRAVRTVTP